MNTVNTNAESQNGDAVTTASIINFSGGTFKVEESLITFLPLVFSRSAQLSNARNVVNTLSALRSNRYQFHNWSNTLRACGYVLDVSDKNRSQLDQDQASCQNLDKVKALALTILICANAVPKARMGRYLYSEFVEDLVRLEYKALDCAIDVLEIKLTPNQKLLDQDYVSNFRHFAAEAISSKYQGFVTADVHSVHKATLLAHDASYYWLANPFPDFLDRINEYKLDMVHCDEDRIRRLEDEAKNQHELTAKVILTSVYARLGSGQDVFYSPYSERYEAAARENLRRLLNFKDWLHPLIK